MHLSRRQIHATVELKHTKQKTQSLRLHDEHNEQATQHFNDNTNFIIQRSWMGLSWNHMIYHTQLRHFFKRKMAWLRSNQFHKICVKVPLQTGRSVPPKIWYIRDHCKIPQKFTEILHKWGNLHAYNGKLSKCTLKEKQVKQKWKN